MMNDLIPSNFRALASFPKSDLFDFFSDRDLATFTPRLELEENEKSITLTAELPGMKEKDVDITIDGDYLTVKGEKKSEVSSKNGDRRYTERCFGAFERTIPLPDGVDPDKIEAKLEHGLLRLTIPKNPATKKDVKKISLKH